MSQINSFHAHVYFDGSDIERARRICEAVRDQFSATMGRMHEKPVGPHPMGSCQLEFRPEAFGPIMQWLVLNREGLVIFTHPDTGHPLEDHRDHAIWMGAMMSLKLDIFD